MTIFSSMYVCLLHTKNTLNNKNTKYVQLIFAETELLGWYLRRESFRVWCMSKLWCKLEVFSFVFRFLFISYWAWCRTGITENVWANTCNDWCHNWVEDITDCCQKLECKLASNFFIRLIFSGKLSICIWLVHETKGTTLKKEIQWSSMTAVPLLRGCLHDTGTSFILVRIVNFIPRLHGRHKYWHRDDAWTRTIMASNIYKYNACVNSPSPPRLDDSYRNGSQCSVYMIPV